MPEELIVKAPGMEALGNWHPADNDPNDESYFPHERSICVQNAVVRFAEVINEGLEVICKCRILTCWFHTKLI
jgi:hypothetical protein